ncbi:MAG: Zn-dependent hydrolase, partial [Deltaproteobacteria bacterium]|nr:Zn-dependent hydrolase [Deltaproteobacteria bacterium]
MKLFLSNLLIMTIFPQKGSAATRKYIYNPGLSNVTSGFKGNIIIDDVFQNLYGQSGGSSLWQVLKWRFSKNMQKKVKDEENYSLPVTPAQTALQDEDNYLLWLGHASWLI